MQCCYSSAEREKIFSSCGDFLWGLQIHSLSWPLKTPQIRLIQYFWCTLTVQNGSPFKRRKWTCQNAPIFTMCGETKKENSLLLLQTRKNLCLLTSNPNHCVFVCHLVGQKATSFLITFCSIESREETWSNVRSTNPNVESWVEEERERVEHILQSRQLCMAVLLSSHMWCKLAEAQIYVWEQIHPPLRTVTAAQTPLHICAASRLRVVSTVLI